MLKIKDYSFYFSHIVTPVESRSEARERPWPRYFIAGLFLYGTGQKQTMLKKIAEAYAENSQVINGAFFAFLIAVLTHRRGSCMDRIVGGILCGLFSTGLYYGIVSIFPTVPQCAAVAIGSFVGFVGVDECKRIILEKIKNVLNTGNKNNETNDN